MIYLEFSLLCFSISGFNAPSEPDFIDPTLEEDDPLNDYDVLDVDYTDTDNLFNPYLSLECYDDFTSKSRIRSKYNEAKKKGAKNIIISAGKCVGFDIFSPYDININSVEPFIEVVINVK